MPRRSSVERSGFIPIPKDMGRLDWKVEIIDSNSVTHDVTNDVPVGEIQRMATEGVSSFNFTLDNTEGKYKGKFEAGNAVNIYYDYLESVGSTVRFRGYLDGIYDDVNGSTGWTFICEGRDCPKSTANEHFADTDVTFQFSARNNLDCWFGTTGDTDDESNYADGVLYNSGLIFQVYDTATSSWRTWKDLSAGQRTTIKAQTEYTKTHTNTYVESKRLKISRALATEGDYEFYIFYNSGNTYFRVHPEDAIINSNESVVMGQNFISLNRFGKDTTEEFNRIKEKGFSDGNIILMRSESDTTRQSVLWIKDKVETTASLTSGDDVSAKATARLNELKETTEKGSLHCCGLPTLQPGEKIHMNVPYVYTGYIKNKSHTISFGTDVGLEFTLDLKKKETSFSRLFKDRIDENVNVTPTDNPNGMTDSYVFDFSDLTDYALTNTEITEEALSLGAGKSEGTCIIMSFNIGKNVNYAELRIKANSAWACTYRISNDAGTTHKNISAGSLVQFDSSNEIILLEITLRETDNGKLPAFDKVNILLK